MADLPQSQGPYQPDIPRAQIPPVVGRVEHGAPIPSDEILIWSGRSCVAWTLMRIIWSGIFIAVWVFLYLKRESILQYPEVTKALNDMSKELKIPPKEIIQYASYVLLFFAFLCALKILKTILRYLNTTYRISSQRIIIRTGVLNITTQQIELFRLKDFAVSQTLVGRIGNYGDLQLISSDRVMPVALLWALPNAVELSEKIRSYAQIARAESGTVKINE